MPACSDQGSIKVAWALERRDVADVVDELHSDVGEEVVEPSDHACVFTDKLAGHHYGAGFPGTRRQSRGSLRGAVSRAARRSAQICH